MGKKALIFIIVGVVLGLAGGAAGVFFIMNKVNEANNPEPVIVEEFDLKDGKNLVLEKIQVPLAQTTSKRQYLQANFTIVFKDEETLTLASGMTDAIKDLLQPW